MRRLAQLVLAIYPFAYRQRYGEEMRALLDDTGADARAVLDLGRGALVAHLRPVVARRLAIRRRPRPPGDRRDVGNRRRRRRRGHSALQLAVLGNRQRPRRPDQRRALDRPATGSDERRSGMRQCQRGARLGSPEPAGGRVKQSPPLWLRR